MSNYKELPCRRCGQVWRWALDKKSIPYCPEGYGCATEPEPSIKELFDKVLERLDAIEEKIINTNPVFPLPASPGENYMAATVCGKCGMNWEGVMGYVCSSLDCPVQLKVGFKKSSYY